MQKKKLKNRILQQLYKPRKKKFSKQLDKLKELDKEIDELMTKIFNKKKK